MPEGSTTAITTQVKEGGTATKKFVTGHYVAFGLVAVVIIGLAIRYRASIVAKLSTMLPATVKKWLAITTAFAIGFVSLFGVSGVAEAAICCAKPVASVVAHSSGWAHAGWGAIFAALAAVPFAFGTLLYPAPDTVEAKMTRGEKQATWNYDSYGAAGPGPFDFYVDGSVPMHPDKKRPLVAVDQLIEVSTTVEQVDTGTNPLFDDDLARLVTSVLMHESKYLGTIVDDKFATGPMIKHIMEFYGNAFNRGADAPVATITVPGEADTNDATFTRFWDIPHAQQVLRNPLESALWLGIINDMNIRVTMPANTVLGGVSTGAILKGASALRVTTGVTPYQSWHWPLINQVTIETCLAGSNSVKLVKFGEKNADGTVPEDYLYAILWLSSLSGLPGNMTLDNLTSIQVLKLGLNKIENIPAFLYRRLKAQKFGLSPIGFDNPNYQDGAIPSGMNLADLRALAIMQPGLSMAYDTMLKVTKGYQLPIDATFGTVPTTTPHAFAVMAMRTLALNLGPALAARSNGNLSATNPLQVTPVKLG